MSIVVDLYSDTITKPTLAMREFMCNASVGDEQKGEDPTVNELQTRVANLLNKPSALFLPSATMANQIALKCHTQPGDEMIAELDSHVLHYEVGGPAVHSGVMVRGLPGQRGCFTPAQLEMAIRPKHSLHMPNTRLVWVENTHNLAGGTVWRLADLASVTDCARANGLKVHMDGARLFNASLASGTLVDKFSSYADTITLCFSKGLGCPGGAMLLGQEDVISQARKYKHMFGGAMRQSGILAGAALYALDHNIHRLTEDHLNAKRFAQGLSNVPGLLVNPSEVETNMVFFQCQQPLDPAIFHAKCLEKGLRFSLMGSRLRAVTHLDVDRLLIQKAVEIVRSVVQDETDFMAG